MDGLIEGVATVGSSVAGGIAGTLGGLWMLSRARIMRRLERRRIAFLATLLIHLFLMVAVGLRVISDAVDNPLFNYLRETGETWAKHQ